MGDPESHSGVIMPRHGKVALDAALRGHGIVT
jgi:hypothetical protein